MVKSPNNILLFRNSGFFYMQCIGLWVSTCLVHGFHQLGGIFLGFCPAGVINQINNNISDNSVKCINTVMNLV